MFATLIITRAFIFPSPIAQIPYLTIIPQVTLDMSWLQSPHNPTSMSGIIVLLKTPKKYQEFFLTLFVKTTDF